MQKIRFKKFSVDAKDPFQATPGSAAFDLFVHSHQFHNEMVEYNSGLAFEIPHNFVGLLFARSSISKSGLYLANGVGVIDSDYRGPIIGRFQKTRQNISLYHVGERFAQIIFLPHPKIVLEEIAELSETLRGANGFGSTGLA